MVDSLSRPPNIDEIPRDWGGLLGLYPLRPVRDEVDRVNVTGIIDAMAGHELSDDQWDFLDTISTLLDAYESEHYPVATPKRRGLDLPRSFIEGHGMSAADLGRLLDVHRSHAAKILRGERSLTVGHVRRLADHFRGRPDLFLD